MMKKTTIKAAVFILFIVASYLGLDLDFNLTKAPEKRAAVPRDVKDYEQARDVFWRELYPKGGGTLYCDEAFTSSDRGRHINIEHVFPMSWVTRSLNCGTREQCRKNSALFNKIEADLHNLFPARKDINKIRRSRPFALIQGERRDFADCDFEVDAKRNLVEPRDAVRGDIARAMFYMAEKYDLVIRHKQYQTLKQWHQQDPVSEAEKSRNKLIEGLQGNINPYIK